MKRDRVTFGMMVGIPLMQLMLFGFAINSDPKHLPTAILSADEGPFTRTLITAMQHSDYFQFVRNTNNEAEARQMLRRGEVQFVINIPVDFSRKLLRGEQPSLLIEADATDPSAVGPAVSALRVISETALNRDLTGPRASFLQCPSSVVSRCSTRSHFSSSPRVSRSASLFRLSPKTNCKPCKWRSSFSCRRFCCPDLCFRFAACPSGHSGLAACSRLPIFCGSCAASCSKEMASLKSLPSSAPLLSSS